MNSRGRPMARRQRRSRALFAVALLVLAAAILAAVLGFPILRSLQFSVSATDITTGTSEYVGLSNFGAVVRDPNFWSALWYTFVYVGVSSAIGFFIGLLLALALRPSFRGRTIFRTALLIPWLLPVISASLLWQWIFNPQFGVLDQLLIQLGWIDHSVAWLSQSPSAMFAIIVATSWQQFPFVMVMVLAALQAVPGELREAANVDGARGLQVFRAVTWPVVRPVSFIVVIVLVISNVQNYTTVQTMTGGGPANTTKTIALYLYELGFKSFDFGQAAAASTLVTILMISLTWVSYSRMTVKES